MNAVDSIVQKSKIVENELNNLAESESLALMFNSVAEYSPEKLKSKTIAAQNRLIEKILQKNFLDKLFHDENLSDEQINLIKYDFRQTAAQLEIPFAVLKTQLRPLALPILALAGAVIGMLVTTLIVRICLGNDYRTFGIIIGSAGGAFLFSLSGVFLSKHERVTRILQVIFGVGIAAEIFTLFSGAVNPFSFLWKKLTGRFGSGIFGKIKRIAYFILAILILQIAIPENKLPEEQLKINSFSAIKSWLEQSVKLLILIGSQFAVKENRAIQPEEKTDLQLLKSLVKLASCTDTTASEFIAQEIILAFKNAGYDVKSKFTEKNPTFSDELKNEFDIEGYINQGDKYKIFEMPLYKNDKLILKGKLARLI